MTLPRDVILDLLPLYLSGDASDTTRALVDEYLRGDPELAARVRAGTTFGIATDSAVAPPPSLEMRALHGTRRRLAAMRWSFGVACFFSAVSLGVDVRHDASGTSAALLLLRYPTLMAFPLAVAIACWVLYLWLRRRARDLA